MNRNIPYLSIIIPVYSEEKRLNNLSKIFSYFAKKKFSYEVVIVNDGSTDSTLKKLHSLQTNNSIIVLSYKQNQGKGFVIKQGMLHSNGRYKLFLDIDLSTPIDQFDKFLINLRNYDVIIGSRRLKESQFVRRQPYLRELMGRIFTKLSQVITGLPISDFTCGFKCFSEKAAKEIFIKQSINRWGFDAEILFIAKIKRLSIKEVPVVWTNDPRSKVRLPHDIITSLLDLFRIRWNFLSGKYS